MGLQRVRHNRATCTWVQASAAYCISMVLYSHCALCILDILNIHCILYFWASWMGGGVVIKNPPANAGGIRDPDLILGWGRSPGGGYGYPLQYSCLEYPMNREAWQVLFHRGCKESDTTECLSMQVCTAQKLLSNIYIFMGVYILRRIFVQTTIWINGRKSIHQHFSFITIQVFLSLIYG